MAKEDVRYDSPKPPSGSSKSLSKDKAPPSPNARKPKSEASMTSTTSSKSGSNSSKNKSSSSKPPKSSKSSKSKSSSSKKDKSSSSSGKDKDKSTSSSQKDKSSSKKDKSSSSSQKDKSSSSSQKEISSSQKEKSSSSSQKEKSLSSPLPQEEKSSSSSQKEKSPLVPKKPKKPQSERMPPSDLVLSPKPKKASSEKQMDSFVSPKGTPRSKRRSSRKSMKKGVRFNKTVGVNTIPNLDSYTKQETVAVWFAPDEYAQMENDCDETAIYMDARQQLVPDMCPRGLEAWTANGEQIKEWNVQEAIEKVWQAQLEQWQSAKDTAECWEYIRGEYLPTSKRSSRDARTLAIKDEEGIQTYLSTTRSVFQSYARRMFGTQRTSGSKIIRRSTSEYTPKASGSKAPIGRNRSGDVSPTATPKSIRSSASSTMQYMGHNENLRSSLKESSIYVSDDYDEEEEKKKASTKPTGTQRSKKVTRIKPQSQSGDNSDAQSVAASYASTVESSIASSRKIVFKPKSKTKIPTSPVGSVADGSIMDESTTSRRMRSHMSVASDDSTRRRMRRTAGVRPL